MASSSTLLLISIIAAHTIAYSMGRSTKARKEPITRSNQARVGKSSTATQATISRFHTLLKRQAQLKSKLESACSSKAVQELADVEKEMDDLGGLPAYQTASILGQDETRGGDTSKLLVTWLKDLDIRPKEGSKLRMLEIGALSPRNHAAVQPWIANTPMDLNSQHPDIIQQDFLERPLPKEEVDRYDVVSCSLVLNFVPDPYDRGKMLLLIHGQLKVDGHVFLVLPRPCIENSRYLDNELLIRIMRHVGFKEVVRKDKEGAKVVYSLWQKQSPDRHPTVTELSTKRVLRTGGKRNNFCVLVK